MDYRQWRRAILCLRKQQVPQSWKVARVTPFPKTTTARLVSDYRPISCLSQVQKLWERHVASLLKPHLSTSKFQFGFKSRSGCGDAALALQTEIIGLLPPPKTAGGRAPPARLFALSQNCSSAFTCMPFGAIISELQDR